MVKVLEEQIFTPKATAFEQTQDVNEDCVVQALLCVSRYIWLWWDWVCMRQRGSHVVLNFEKRNSLKTLDSNKIKHKYCHIMGANR